MKTLKNNLSYLLIGICLVAGLALLGYAMKGKVRKAPEAKDMLQVLQPLVNEPTRLLFSADSTNKDQLQLGYTFVTESSEEESKDEVLKITKDLANALKDFPNVSTVSVVGFNTTIKKPLRIVIGQEILNKHPDLFKDKETALNTLRKTCPFTSPKNLKSFCNLSSVFIEPMAMNDKAPQSATSQLAPAKKAAPAPAPVRKMAPSQKPVKK